MSTVSIVDDARIFSFSFHDRNAVFHLISLFSAGTTPQIDKTSQVWLLIWHTRQHACMPRGASRRIRWCVEFDWLTPETVDGGSRRCMRQRDRCAWSNRDAYAPYETTEMFKATVLRFFFLVPSLQDFTVDSRLPILVHLLVLAGPWNQTIIP